MAMAILAVGIIGIVRLLPTGIRASKSSGLISKAAFLAQEKLEELKLGGFDAISAESPDVDLTGTSGVYSWEVEVSEVTLVGLVNSDNVRELKLLVNWLEKGKTKSEIFVTYIGK